MTEETIDTIMRRLTGQSIIKFAEYYRKLSTEQGEERKKTDDLARVFITSIEPHITLQEKYFDMYNHLKKRYDWEAIGENVVWGGK